MGQRHKSGVTPESAAERALRDEEVRRANRELVAYFKGRRTEREARAALKIIKAFVRSRERLDPGDRPALPGADAAKPPKKGTTSKAVRDSGGGSRRTPPRRPREKSSKSAAGSSEPKVRAPSEASPESDEPTP
jgi:hypothetical protein